MSHNKGLLDWGTWYSDLDLDALVSTWGREDDDKNITLRNKFSEYYLSKSNLNHYYIKTQIRKENITYLETISFKNKIINVHIDMIDIFDQLNEIDRITGKFSDCTTQLSVDFLILMVLTIG